MASLITSEDKKFVRNKKGVIGMEVYYLCQPNTYVIAITAVHQIHEQCIIIGERAKRARHYQG